MKKKTVLIESHLVINGGIEVFLQTLVEHLLKKGYDVTVSAIPYDPSDFQRAFSPEVHCVQRKLIKKGYKKHSLRWWISGVCCELRDFLVTVSLYLARHDIVIAISSKAPMRRAAVMPSKRKFGWVHMDYRTAALWQTSRRMTPEQEKKLMQRFEKVVCVSQTVLESVKSTIGDPGNLCVRYNPIDYHKIYELAKAPCGLKKNPNRPLIVSVGRLAKEKQYLMFLQVCKNLCKEIDFDVWIIGEGSERPALEEYIARENLSFVRLLGSKQNPYAYLKQADLFVSASATEAYGLAVQEALILGVPVVAVNNAGIDESFDTRLGFKVNNDAAEVENAVRKMLLEPQTREMYREHIAKFYSTEELYEKRLEAICSLWEDQPPRE